MLLLDLLTMSAALAVGGTHQLSHVPGYTLTGRPTEASGARVSAAGDVNHDGFNDFMVYSVDLIGPGLEDVVRVHSGVDGALLHSFGALANHPFDGIPMAGVGDLSEDECADIIVGNASQSRATVYSGCSGAELFTLTGDAVDDGFGGAVAAAGDVNADGHPDIIVGTVAYYPSGTHGYARVFSGADGSVLFTLHEESAGDLFGAAVSGAGDVNADGHADLLVGAHADGRDFLNPGFPPFVPPFLDEDLAGAVSVFSGVDGSLLWTAYGDGEYAGFGWSVAPVGDVNHDGRDDVAAGNRDLDVPAMGSARLLSGADGATLQMFTGNDPTNAHFVGTSHAGDLDGDAIPDVLVAGWVTPGPPVLEVHVNSGADGQDLFIAAATSATSAVSAAGLGDINGDGIGDFVIGAWEQIPGGGSVRVYVSQGAPAQSIAYGCGINPPGSLAVTAGTPALGAPLTLMLDDPTGGMGSPALAFLLVASQPDAAFPCGTLKPGWGLGAPGSRGELLVSVAPPDPLLLLDVGTWSGTPLELPLTVPVLAELVGKSVYLQGALVDASHHVGLTTAVQLVIGVP